ncbi:MAG TPA: DUF1287 domain-containing protein [Steroidobacteraceae bacterium]|nr:DUF1287 domain-containing protein [Steroidobacteraceae bacterium]
MNDRTLRIALGLALACVCIPAAARAAGNADILAAARDQVGVTVHYDPAYRSLRYPGGDVPADRGLSKPDANIDHRRVPNLMTYFRRAGYTAPLTRAVTDYLPGDIVAWDLGRGVLHVGIVSDIVTVDGTPLVVHNIGSGAREEDILFRYRVIGHYRLPPTPAGESARPTGATH